MPLGPFPVVAVALETPPRDAREAAYYRALAAYVGERGGLVFGASPEHLARATRRGVRGFPLSGGSGTPDFYPTPHVVYNRLRRRSAETSPAWEEALRRLAHLNVAVVNARFLDKWTVHECLAATPLRRHLPPTTPYADGAHLRRVLEEWGRVYLKPRHGSGGRGIYVLTREAPLARSASPEEETPRTRERGEFPVQVRTPTSEGPTVLPLGDFLRRTHRHLRSRGYLVQHALPALSLHGRPVDARIVVVWDGGRWRIASAVLRLGRPGSPVSNIAQGGTALPLRKTWPLLRRRFPRLPSTDAPLRRLALRAAEALADCGIGPIGELGVDLLPTPHGRTYLLELNAKPDKRGSRAGLPPTVPPLHRMFVAFARNRRHT
ncbi:YheC/YheD family protein [Brockia lithotrophica]|uniref:YheC/D-like protein n=1 Tax=Brockia lithotrophica TaxID=933949 RepID=A0A660KXC0_9BACL|nr:YheC/YheD family protein [Brockia lithotrophica]RKQ84666.1 YheC/D-like protein [Brockia lithotrophica]